MPVTLIEVPYDSGHRDWRMGRGPAALIAGGAVERLGGNEVVDRVTIDSADPHALEIGRAFELQRGVAAATRAATAAGAVPVVLAGNCSATLGALAGLGRSRIGLAWFDSHADFNTPETSPSGFLDGMAVAMITGDCWTGPTATVEGFRPLAEDRIALIGVRDIDPGERQRLQASSIRHLSPRLLHDDRVPKALEPVLADWADRLDGVYLHMDLDVHDPDEAPVNPYQAADGPSAATVRELVRALAARLPLVGCTFSAYAPEGDPRRLALGVALDLIGVVGAALAR